MPLRNTKNSSTPSIDYQAPDYVSIFEQRHRRLAKLREDKDLLEALKIYYRTHPADFISDWGMTFEPRNIERGLIPVVPFVLWDKQRDYINWLYAKWRGQERGLVEKSRDCGVSWLSVGFAACMWCFEPGYIAGFGSRKEELVDKRGDEKSLFEKAWFFISNLPREFRPTDFVERKHRAHMRILNPNTGATIVGEAGDNIGRGGRTSIYFVDEAAFVEHQQLVDNALSQNTNCQIDISTPNGNGNPFYKKRLRLDKSDRLFIFDWRDDPRKDDAWYFKQTQELDAHTVAQEIDRDYNASNEDAFIPALWISAAIDAHKKLGFDARGIRTTGFDPADVGDAKATVSRHGSVVTQAAQKVQGEIPQAINWAFDIADQHRADALLFDGDGMGAPSMKVKLQNHAKTRFKVLAYHGSGAVRLDGTSKKSKRKKHHDDSKQPIDQYLNFRAQSYSWVRERFEKTYDAVSRAAQGFVVHIDPEELISIDSECEELVNLQAELSRPQRQWTNNGLIKVESKADMKKREVDSPNLADALVIAFSVSALPKAQPKPNVPTFAPADAGMGY